MAGFDRYIEHDPYRYRSWATPNFAHADQSWLALRGAYWSITHKLDRWGDVPLGSEAQDIAEDFWRHAYVMTASKACADAASP